MMFLRLFFESFVFAVNALKSNLLRTTLSLLGVTVGIFAIVSVLTVVDTLDGSIKKSLSFLGNNVIYVEKWPWSMTPDYPWWKYVNRPDVQEEELHFLEENLTKSSAIAMFGLKFGLTANYKANSISNISMQGVTYSYNQVSDVEIAKGRYFSEIEAELGSRVVLLGHFIAEELFPHEDPIGKIIKVRGAKLQVIGVIEKQGENLFGTPSNDLLLLTPYKSMVSIFQSKKGRLFPKIAIKGYAEDENLEELEAEIRGLMRRYRSTNPKEDDTFALNRPEYIMSVFDGIIIMLNFAGWIIGGFSMLIGGFGIANIMFVSVKERTNIIGIQKALGAKNYFILFQFLFEAVALSVVGGLLGILMVTMLTALSTESFQIALSWQNVMVGLSVSSIIGVLSGIIPAMVASRMDPVIAIRSK